MRRHVQLLRQPEFHIFLFFILFLLLNWPFTSVAGANGLMSLFIYLYAVGFVTVFLFFLIQRTLRDTPTHKDRNQKGGG